MLASVRPFQKKYQSVVAWSSQLNRFAIYEVKHFMIEVSNN